jgi:hypothetical protein
MVPMLVPLVRLYQRAGLGAGEFALAAKLAFIRVVAEQATVANRLNISGIAAGTGLTRKEVFQLVSLDSEAKPLPDRRAARQRTNRVLQGWITDPTYHDREGNPRALPLHGGEVSFAGLVKRFAGDVTPVSTLAELKRSGAVTQAATGLIRLSRQTTRQSGYNSEVLSEVAGRVADLASTLVDNIERSDRPVYTGFQDINELPASAALLFNSVFSQRAAFMLDGVARWAASQKALNKKKSKPEAHQSRRVGVGIYFIDEPAGRNKKKLPVQSLKQRGPRQKPKRPSA